MVSLFLPSNPSNTNKIIHTILINLCPTLPSCTMLPFLRPTAICFPLGLQHTNKRERTDNSMAILYLQHVAPMLFWPTASALPWVTFSKTKTLVDSSIANSSGTEPVFQTIELTDVSRRTKNEFCFMRSRITYLVEPSSWQRQMETVYPNNNTHLND